MRVLVTGHRGYIGSVVATVLRHMHFEVVGLDCDLYAGCGFGRTHHPIPSFDINVREVEVTDLLPFEAVVHLAALPMEMCDAESGRDLFGVDEETTNRLAECCKKANVARFLFASTCEVYGRVGRALCDEHYPTSPLGEAAGSKLRCEEMLTSLSDRAFSPTILRIPDVYGVSPQMRLEPIVNEFTASAVVSGRVNICGDAAAWRSVIHVEDLARTLAAVLATDEEASRVGICNLAAPEAAYRVVDIADAVTDQIPRVVRSTPRPAYDSPSYRADGSKFAKLFPKFAFRWTLEAGIRQLASAFGSAGLTPGEYRSDRYRRLLKLRSSTPYARSPSTIRRRETSAA